MSKNNVLYSKSKRFVQQFFKAYFENGDFDVVKSMLHDDISWIDVAHGKVYTKYDEVRNFLEKAQEKWIKGYRLAEEKYDAIIPEEKYCVIFGTAKLINDDIDILLNEAKLCFSVICTMQGDNIKLFHTHFLVQNAEYIENKHSYEQLTESYNFILKQKLEENSKLLEGKTKELKTITNNIIGGLHICEMDDSFTMLYYNEGFLKLAGYYRDEMQMLYQNKFVPIIYPDDIEKIKQEIITQTEVSDTFALEYRLVKKDGSVIWVLDKGNVFTGNNNRQLVQCFLTDITEQKKQEEDLNISKQRYEILLQQLDITMFEYDITTKELIFFDDVAQMYNVPKIIPNGPEEFVRKGIIHKDCAKDYLEMYEKIHAGAAYASCYITSIDANAKRHDFELTLTTVFDLSGKPVRAVGIRKNISHIMQLEREMEYSKTLMADKFFVCEIDISNNKILELNEDWMKKLNISKDADFFEVLYIAKDKLVAPEHQELFLQRVSQEYITNEYHKGTKMFAFEYKRNGENGAVFWYKATLNIIRDEITGNLRVRYYTTDITGQKAKENDEMKTKVLYNNMVAKSKLVYEANISRNFVVKGHEHWYKNFGILTSDNYEEMINVFAKKAIYKKDIPEFLWRFNRINIINAFKKGKKQIVCEYKRINENKVYEWTKCTFHLYEEPASKDIKGYFYVESIDKQKREELALKYKARHDAMTHLLNKEYTQIEITSFLKNSDAKLQTHAFLIVDIDHFKNLNDTLGHLYGDNVLTEISRKLRAVFRKEDIIGRIGGDEFVVFMKDIASEELLIKKAKEICTKLFAVYECDEKKCAISASVGIAIYKKHGTTYKELYKHADAALYVSKDNGRNQYYM